MKTKTLAPNSSSVAKRLGSYGKKMKNGGSLGMKSVKAGYDKNPGVTRADIIVAAKKQAKKGASIKKAQDGKSLENSKPQDVSRLRIPKRNVSDSAKEAALVANLAGIKDYMKRKKPLPSPKIPSPKNTGFIPSSPEKIAKVKKADSTSIKRLGNMKKGGKMSKKK